jgi:hypothetical protein
MPHTLERKLIESRYDWICSLCGCPFFNPDWVVAGPTLMAIVQHFKKMQDQAFTNHVCPSTSENKMLLGLLDASQVYPYQRQ